MRDADHASKLDAITKLAQSRAEIKRVLDPPPRLPHAERFEHSAHENIEAPDDGTFPRSRTMRLLMSGRGIGTVGALVGGLLMTRPALAFKLLRMLPTGAVARMLMVKAVTAFRNR